ncbi:MAG TPA: hypothetical protein VN823_07265, partial [Stellaceae bacterium]|nr:hypothetical protein [Stellaceae bacterium]
MAVKKIESTLQGKKRLKTLEDALLGLDVTIGTSSDGQYTVFTTREPLFCFVRPTEKEVEDLIRETLTSYIQNFYYPD